MADAVFPHSDDANKKKKILKDKLKYTRAPILDYDKIEETREKGQLHRQVSYGVSSILGHCSLCYTKPCEPGCPLQFKQGSLQQPEFVDEITTISKSGVQCPGLDVSKPTRLGKKILENECKFVESLTKIKSRHVMELDEINCWKTERGESPRDIEPAKSVQSSKESKRHIKFRTLAEGKINVIQAFIDAGQNKTPDKEKSPGLRMPPIEWSCKKNSLERRGNNLVRVERAKQERQDNLPSIPVKCQHQNITYHYDTYDELDVARATQTLSNEDERERLKTDTASADVSPGVRFSKLIGKGSLGGRLTKGSSASYSVHSSPNMKVFPLSRADRSDSPRIALAISNPQNKVGETGEAYRKTMSIKDDCDFCQACGALPCMKLTLCEIVRSRQTASSVKRKDSLQIRTLHFVKIFGQERVDALNTKEKRVQRNQTLTRKVKLCPKVCRGTEGCSTCKESPFYHREETDHRAAMIEETRLKCEAGKPQIDNAGAGSLDK